jgi:hypothetical protein
MTGQYKSETYVDAQDMVRRRCTTCGQLKYLYTDFHRNGVDDDGHPAYRLECKTCYNAKRKENKISNKHAEFIGHQHGRGEEDIDYTFAEWRETVIFFGGECAYCGRTMRKGETLTRDHLFAQSKGGKTTQDNVVPACSSCNSSKGNSDFKDWYMKQSFFSQERLNRIFQWRTLVRAAGGGSDDNE